MGSRNWYGHGLSENPGIGYGANIIFPKVKVWKKRLTLQPGIYFVIHLAYLKSTLARVGDCTKIVHLKHSSYIHTLQICTTDKRWVYTADIVCRYDVCDQRPTQLAGHLHHRHTS